MYNILGQCKQVYAKKKTKIIELSVDPNTMFGEDFQENMKCFRLLKDISTIGLLPLKEGIGKQTNKPYSRVILDRRKISEYLNFDYKYHLKKKSDHSKALIEVLKQDLKIQLNNHAQYMFEAMVQRHFGDISCKLIHKKTNKYDKNGNRSR